MTRLALSSLIIVCLGSQSAGSDESGIKKEDYETCGLTSLYVVCHYLGVNASWGELREVLGPPTPDGLHSFADLSRAAGQFGLTTRGFHLSVEKLKQAPLPAIIQTSSGFGMPEPHLLVLLRCTSAGVYLLDPPYAIFMLPWSAFQQVWTGNILLVAKSDEAGQIEQFSAVIDVERRGSWVAAFLGITALLLLVAMGAIAAYQARSEPFVHSLYSWRVLRWVLALTLLGGLSAAVIVRESEQSPTLALQHGHRYLGEFAPGKHIVEIPLSNTGKTDLWIRKVTSNCTCAAATAPPVIAPGATEVCKLEISVKPGTGSAILEFISNDPAGPKALRVVWHGSSRPFLSPAIISPGVVQLSERITKSVAIVYPGGRSAIVPIVETIECDSDLIKVRALGNRPEATIAPVGEGQQVNGHLEFAIDIYGPKQPALLETECRFRLRYGESSLVLSLPIFVQHVSGVRTLTDQFAFTASSARALVGQSRTIVVLGASESDDFEAVDLPPWLSFSSGSRNPARIECLLRIRNVPEPANNELQIRLQSRKEPTCMLPIQVTTRVFK